MDVIGVQSYGYGEWIGPDGGVLIDSPVTGRPIAEAGAVKVDPGGMARYAREVGGPALRALTIHERARRLKALATHLNERKEELYRLNYLTGATRADGWIDIDGGIATAFVMASKARREMTDGHLHLDGGVEQLSRSGGFVGQHVCAPLHGVAVHINAFNFPVWGMLEKLAPALVAGVPVIVKPATQTCYLTEACFRMMLESGTFPEGSFQLLCGGVGDLLDHLGAQDVVGFTGAAETARKLRATPSLIANATRFIAEQDSLNASILGPDAAPGTEEFDAFIGEAANEITVKAGQKCTAIRRVIAPRAHLDAVVETLSARLAETVIGDPEAEGVKMGALASVGQRDDVLEKAGLLAGECARVFGDPQDFALKGADPARGAFLPPMLFRCDSPDAARAAHDVEAFGPVSTLMPYDGPEHAAWLANRGGGSLVASVFTHDPTFARDVALASGPWHGRLYFANRDTGREATGHGSPLPHLVHGGPGRAGGGEELGGVRGVLHYMQRTAIQGPPQIVAAISGRWSPGAPEIAPPKHPFRMRFGELQPGHAIWTDSREVTLEDIEHFAEFTGDRFYAHMDEAAAAANPFFPGRVAHGYLLLSFAAGLFVDPDPGPVLANTGLDNLRFQKPVVPGDHVRARLVVKAKTRRTDDYGEVRWDVTLFDQDGAATASYELLTMVAI